MVRGQLNGKKMRRECQANPAAAFGTYFRVSGNTIVNEILSVSSTGTIRRVGRSMLKSVRLMAALPLTVSTPPEESSAARKTTDRVWPWNVRSPVTVRAGPSARIAVLRNDTVG